jgi:hypothetical protein
LPYPPHPASLLRFTSRSSKGKYAHKPNLDAEKGDPKAESKVSRKKISKKETESHR